MYVVTNGYSSDCAAKGAHQILREQRFLSIRDISFFDDIV